MISTQIPRSPRPSEPALLNSSNLELLSSPHEKHRVQEFVASQTRYAKAQANEGRAVRASWYISTPEKDRMRLHQLSVGFETPVLRPRAAQIQAEPSHPPASPPRLKSPAHKPTRTQSPGPVKKAKATPAVLEALSPKRQKGPGKKSTTAIKKKSGTSNPTRKERHARSDTDEEHLARLTERRERKRARQEIMGSREDRAGTRGEKENKKDAKNEHNDKKKQRIPAGLALMHGFSSASVGKSRLTMEPPPNFGVFHKGRASAKIKVNDSKRAKQRGFPSRIFSEDRFLDTGPAKSPDERLDSRTSSDRNISNEPSSPVKMKKPAAAQLQKTPIKTKGTAGRCRRAASVECDSETANSYASRAVGVRGAKPTDQADPVQSRSPARSISWVIEQDGFSLPSTASDIAIASVKSKPETALLDVRAAAWSRILKDDLPGEIAPLTSELHLPQAISTLPTATSLQKVTSNPHVELEELGTIGPWESASQVARSTLRVQEPRSAYSRYFALPHSGEPGFTQPMVHLADDLLGQPAGVDGTRPNDAGETMGGSLVHEEAGVDHQDGDVFPPFAPASNKTSAFPEERVSANQTSSLDSVNRALLLDDPRVTRRRSRTRRRLPWPEFNSTPENMLFQQYGLDLTDSYCEVSGPFFHDSKPADASHSLGDTLGYLENSFREDNTDGLEENTEDQARRNEWHPDIISDLHEFASDVVYTPPNALYDCRGGTPFFMGEQDTGYDGVNETEEDCTGFTSVSMPSAGCSGFLEDDADEATDIHLWSDEAWARVGGNALQEGCSHLTTVQMVEQDVAKTLKDHWFPHKF